MKRAARGTVRTSSWLFSRRLDLLAFLAPALASLVLLGIGWQLGLVNGQGEGERDTPALAWLGLVVLVDVAHVWGNLLWVYADPKEYRRRPLLWLSIPVVTVTLGVALSTESERWLWRAVAALAVWHFVRQQVGWVKLYRARNDEGEDTHARLLRAVDLGAIYAATVAPILWWHANLPRPFWWLAEGDFFLPLPPAAGTLAMAFEALALIAYGVRSVRAYTQGRGNPGKDLVITTTALLWWLGIVMLESDYAFTVTNVLIHGVPYAILIAVTARRRIAAGASVALPLRHGIVGILVALWTCAWIEEVFWDRLLWHEHPEFFPLPGFELGGARPWVLALLVVPQVTHYLLDAVLWRRSDNPYLLAR